MAQSRRIERGGAIFSSPAGFSMSRYA